MDLSAFNLFRMFLFGQLVPLVMALLRLMVAPHTIYSTFMLISGKKNKEMCSKLRWILFPMS